ncbi:MAG: hypothetical protein IJ887_04450 [Prevotella sp.]|nr:hypothetical protein [Prevotella sp.]
MKKLLFLCVLIFFAINVKSNDSLMILSLQREVSNLKSAISNLRQEDAKLRASYQKQMADFDSLRVVQDRQGEVVEKLAQKVGAGLTEANKKIDDNTGMLSDSIKVRTWLGLLVILFAIILLALAYVILRKRINKDSSSINKIRTAQESLKAAQKAMQEESVKLDNKLIELLDKQVVTQPEGSGTVQPDHSLALKVADEIVRIETNLSRMDESVKGYKQLKKAVERIRTNFLANGYEIVEMLGKPYNEGMKVVANFVSDDTLAEGEQKITGIIKPQINYKGKMIQSAQITVSQNL